jgi:3-carboxy-cis,cis-muconate cycloisomerase
MVLVAKRALQPIVADSLAAADAAAELAERHRHTPMMARKLLQDAVPTSFGLLAAQWMTAIDGGSAAAWARDMLEHLDVYAEAMRSGAGPDPDLGAASQLIDRALVNHRA